MSEGAAVEGGAQFTSDQVKARGAPRREGLKVPSDFIGKVKSGVIVNLRKNRNKGGGLFGFISIGTEEEKTTAPRIYFNSTSFTADTDNRARNGHTVSFKVIEDKSGRPAASFVTITTTNNDVTTPHEDSGLDSKNATKRKSGSRRRPSKASVAPSNTQSAKKENKAKNTGGKKEEEEEGGGGGGSTQKHKHITAELAGKRPLLASEVPRVGCGCFLLSPDHPGKALFGRRKGSHGAGKYALPGGKLELDEEVEACIAREIKEEVNVDLLTTDVQQIGITNDRCMDGDKNKHYITIHCRAVIPAGSSAVQNMEPNKCEGWEWKTYEEIHDMWQVGLKTGEHSLFEPTQRLLQSGKVDKTFWAHM